MSSRDPLRAVTRRRYFESGQGVILFLECGHELVRPRKYRNFTSPRVRCPLCNPDRPIQKNLIGEPTKRYYQLPSLKGLN